MKRKKYTYIIPCGWCSKDIFTDRSYQKYCNPNHRSYWYRKNKDWSIKMMIKCRRKYQQTHKEHYLSVLREWRKKHPDYQKGWLELHPGYFKNYEILRSR